MRIGIGLAALGLASISFGNPQPGDPTEALFLGNSYTARNDLPGLVEGLAASGGHSMSTSRNTPGGNTLGAPQSNGSPHSSNSTSLGLISSSPWDVVVLQEQSYLPTLAFPRNQYMYPGAQSLEAAIHANDPNTRILLYQTWGRRDGGQFCWNSCQNFADFDAMQDELTSAYDGCASLIGAEVAPVGEAWRLARALQPGIVLHVGDGSHPNVAGSYLAACVFYGRIFDESPVGLSFDAGLPASEAAFLQEVAWYTLSCGIEDLCGTSPNSAGPGAEVFVSGSVSIAANDLVLTVSGLPSNVSGLFFFGTTTVNLPFGDGVRCVGGGITRLTPGTADVLGSRTQALDMQAAPLAGLLTPGQAAPFQYWYRDPAVPMGSGFNVSSAKTLTPCP